MDVLYLTSLSQTLSAISAEKNSTIVFPLPIDLITYFLKTNDAQTQKNAKAALSAAKAKATEILSVSSSTHLALDQNALNRVNGDDCGKQSAGGIHYRDTTTGKVVSDVATVASVLQQQQSTAM